MPTTDVTTDQQRTTPRLDGAGTEAPEVIAYSAGGEGIPGCMLYCEEF